LQPLTTGWWGKLPTQGDFIGHGLPETWRQVWDDWLQRGLALAQQRFGRVAAHQRLQSMAPWQCLVPPVAGNADPSWAGVVVPGIDRVGRGFPVLLVEAYGAEALDRAGVHALQQRALRLADWLDQIGVQSAPGDFAAGAFAFAGESWDGAADDAAAPPQTVGALRAAHPAAGSFWWRPEPVGAPAAPWIDSWPPRDELVLEWLGGAAADPAG
ncbi:MAG: type VI secretion system-associated protein TagF, partial [Rubrivivax sp.]